METLKASRRGVTRAIPAAATARATRMSFPTSSPKPPEPARAGGSGEAAGDELGAFLSRAAAKERARMEKHLASCDADSAAPGRGELWRKSALMLDRLSGAGVESAGAQAWRFFIPDGKYRMQVFALEDRGDGVLRICLPDVLDDAVKRKLLKRTDTEGEYAAKGIRGPLRIERIEAGSAGSSGGNGDPPAHVKSMLGWKRRAIQVSLSINSESSQLAAARSLCELAARNWKI